MALFHCNEDFYLEGESTLHCVWSDEYRPGVWDGERPVCKSMNFKTSSHSFTEVNSYCPETRDSKLLIYQKQECAKMPLIKYFLQFSFVFGFNYIQSVGFQILIILRDPAN